MAQKQLTPIDMNGNAITNLPTTPSANNDAASKSYVDTKASFVRVIHGATASTARPTGVTHVEWVGSVAPTNANTTNDTWIDTT